MRTITVNLNCQIEERLRQYTGRKGDLSKIANEAFKLWLDQKEGLILVAEGSISVVPKKSEGEQ
jgi:hypothetical protein